ncbi:MAG TPA: DUF2281 domain-containing protein [Verrucomicrobiae bacterium]|nr:DUF2281 domain-containing protein [Verrucomicrobiae bacterium]
MSVAEQIFEKAQVLPESAQKTVLDLVDKLARQNAASPPTAPKAGSAKGLVHMAPDFDQPLEISQQKRVQLPLIDSKEPGILDLTHADIEELLA